MTPQYGFHIRWRRSQLAWAAFCEDDGVGLVMHVRLFSSQSVSTENHPHPNPPLEGEGTDVELDQQRINPLHVSRRIIGQATFRQQRLIKQNVCKIAKQCFVRC